MATDAEFQRETHEKPGHDRSVLERFFDNFLQESSIKWILMIGVAIVAGCSLMLVTQKWSGWPITLKYLTILTYTAATYLVAELCDRRLGLRATSQVLKLLTIALLPIGFLALAALTRDTGSIDVHSSLYTLLMMVPATVFMGFAADRIFRHWLQGRQLTFLVSYMLLCLAGALPVVNQSWLAVLFACGFWLVMTLGVLKVNRHVFWLTEEHRWPRVYGFTPIAILGTQLIALYVTKTVGAVPLHWLGLGLVMLAATILMTTRTIANVFRQRTGDLVRPLPMSLIAPLFVGLMLVATGVVFSFHGFQFVDESTRAVVPTALLAAGLLIWIAKDTRHPGFVWAGLIMLTIGYQSCPTLFSSLVQSIKATAASSLHESRLPLAFYGLTYMPLLVAFAIAARLLQDRRLIEFSFPLKRYTTCLSLLLLVLALTNIKAAFIVAAISVVTFLVFAILFRDREHVKASVASLLIATTAAVPFANVMGWVDCDYHWSLVALSLVGLVLGATHALDRLVRRIPKTVPATHEFAEMPQEANPWIQYVGRATTLIISCAWVITNAVDALARRGDFLDLHDGAMLGIILLSLLIATLQTKHLVCGWWTWCLASLGGWFWLISENVPMTTAFAAFGIVSGAIGIATFACLRFRKIDITVHRFATARSAGSLTLPSRMVALFMPLADIAIAQFIVIVIAYYLPALLWATATLDIALVPPAWPIIFGLIGMAAMLFRGPIVTTGLVFIAPIAAGIAVGQWMPDWFTHDNLPLVYSIASSLILVGLHGRVETQNKSMLRTTCLWMYGLIALGFISLAPSTAFGALLALGVTYWLGRSVHSDYDKTIFAAIASGLFIVSLGMLSGYRGFTIQLALSPLGTTAAAWMMLGVVAAIAWFDQPWRSLDVAASRSWSLGLRAIGVALAAACFAAGNLAPWLETTVVVAFIGAAINEFRTAIRTQQEAHVFGGFAVIAMVAAWIHLQHSLLITPTALRLLLIVGATAAFLLAKLWDQHATLSIMVRSLRFFGLTTPFMVAGGSLITSHYGSLETLSVFGAAMILFAYGLARHSRRYVLAAAVIMNLGLFSLWNAMSLSDPQFYLVPVGLTVIGLVELLRHDISVKAHDPLRYAGALAILVSPCFDILGGSWIHMMSLMLLSVIVILLAIGLRLRALIHTGTAFLLVDLAAMVIRSSIDNPGMLWFTGLLIGATVIALAAICERNREQFLSRIRVLSAQLATWH